ncbi:hypothetical protein NHX12_013225 [Muraenolepis orangiensis]|uniref:Laminin IV type B domain-containing protein n=1 Tax=Muraenolepis orangiensis TaxID=630683 RepID=A0A9Q0DG03_9TELE|nr:hypothetical protein NHX12_013225 [Muraenolepis orangiensis]
MFGGGVPGSEVRRQAFERYRCQEAPRGVSRPLLSDTCAKLMTSMSAVINDGALRESHTPGDLTLLVTG